MRHGQRNSSVVSRLRMKLQRRQLGLSVDRVMPRTRLIHEGDEFDSVCRQFELCGKQEECTAGLRFYQQHYRQWNETQQRMYSLLPYRAIYELFTHLCNGMQTEYEVRDHLLISHLRAPQWYFILIRTKEDMKDVNVFAQTLCPMVFVYYENEQPVACGIPAFHVIYEKMIQLDILTSAIIDMVASQSALDFMYRSAPLSLNEMADMSEQLDPHVSMSFLEEMCPVAITRLCSMYPTLVADSSPSILLSTRGAR